MGNDILRQKAEVIENIDEALAKTANNMLVALKEGKGVGLAGPQVAVMKRIFVTHVQGDVPRIFINPSLLETSGETAKMEEGCLSVPGIFADVVRAKMIKIQAWNEKGKPFTLEAGGILARVILHELDHLEGILFLDRLSEVKRNRLTAKFEKQAKTRALDAMKRG